MHSWETEPMKPWSTVWPSVTCTAQCNFTCVSLWVYISQFCLCFSEDLTVMSLYITVLSLLLRRSHSYEFIYHSSVFASQKISQLWVHILQFCLCFSEDLSYEFISHSSVFASQKISQLWVHISQFCLCFSEDLTVMSLYLSILEKLNLRMVRRKV